MVFKEHRRFFDRFQKYVVRNVFVVVLVQENHGFSWGRVCISCSVLVIVGLFLKLGSETVCFVKNKTKA